MKSKRTKPEAAAPSPKSKLKIHNLKLSKETLQNLSDQEANAVKGGVKTVGCSATLSPS